LNWLKIDVTFARFVFSLNYQELRIKGRQRLPDFLDFFGNNLSSRGHCRRVGKSSSHSRKVITALSLQNWPSLPQRK